jgi:hypothetical protein
MIGAGSRASKFAFLDFAFPDNATELCNEAGHPSVNATFWASQMSAILAVGLLAISGRRAVPLRRRILFSNDTLIAWMLGPAI